jgi:hypothetical protein
MKFLRDNLGADLAAAVLLTFLAILLGVGTGAAMNSYSLASGQTCYEGVREVTVGARQFCDYGAKLSVEVINGRTYARCTCSTVTP